MSDLRQYTKDRIFQTVGYKIYAKEVADFHLSTARYRVVTAANRAGKSYLAGHDVLGDVFPPLLWDDSVGRAVPTRTDQLIWIVAPDYGLCKEFDYLYEHLVTNRKRYGWAYEVMKGTVNNPKQGNMRIALKWGETADGKVATTVIEGKSATNEKGLQSEEVHVAIMSEAADQDERILNQYLLPRCGKIIFPTTPKIKAEYIRAFVEEGTNEEFGIEVFEIPPSANPYYDWERFRIQALKAESRVGKPYVYEWEYREEWGPNPRPRGMVLRGSSCAEEDPYFAETCLGLWTYEAERVLPFRWEPDANGMCHVIHDAKEVDWIHGARTYVSTDYGYTDPASAGFWAVGTDNTKVRISEIYETRLGADEFVGAIKSRCEQLGIKPTYFIGDPQKPEVNHYFQRLNLPVTVSNKAMMRDRQAGHMKIVDELSINPSIGRPQLYVLSERCGGYLGCPNTIQEWKLLRRKKGATSEYSPSSFVGEDHAYDDTRYFLQTEPQGEAVNSSWRDMQEHRRDILLHRGNLPPQASGDGLRGYVTG